MARAAGQLSGRAVGTFLSLRSSVEAAAEGAAFSEAQKDLRDGMHQLHAIRDEIRSGFSPLQSRGGAAARALRSARGDTAADEEEFDASAPQQPQQAPRWASRSGPATAWAPTSAPPDTARPSPSSFSSQFIPISAAALGRLPVRRPGAVLTGADILEDAFAEEAVAREAMRLMRDPAALADAARMAGRPLPPDV